MGKPVLIKRRPSRSKIVFLGIATLCLSTVTSMAQQSPNNNTNAPLADYLRRLSQVEVTPAAPKPPINQANQTVLQTPQRSQRPQRSQALQQPEQPQPRRLYQTATERASTDGFDTVRQGAFAVPEERPVLPQYGVAPARTGQTRPLEPLTNLNERLAAPLAQQDPSNPLGLDQLQTGRTTPNGGNRANGTNAQASTNIDPQNPNRLQRVLNARRAEPAQPFPLPRRTPNAAPFAATGINAGIWNFRPSITTGLEVTTDQNTTTTAVITNLSLDADANLSAATMALNSQLTLRKAIGDESDIDMTGNAALNASRDLSNHVQALAGVNFQRSRVSATGDLTTLNTTSTDTDLNTFSANFGLQNQNAKTQISGNLEISRDMYDDLVTSGATIDQSDRNNTSITGTLRLGYEVSPAIAPFVQVATTRRIMDNKKDANGLEQSGYTLDTSIGTTFNLGEKLNGEASIGWLRTTFDDDQLETNDALTLNALINWSPRRNTTIALDVNTTSNAGIGTSAGNAISYATGLSISQQLRDNFAISARLGHTYLGRSAANDENQINLNAQANYQFNRYFGMSGGVEHQITKTDGAENQSATTFRLGLTARR